MLKAQPKTLSGANLRKAGWDALVERIGLVNATRFMLQHESGHGDYTKIRKEMFKGKRVSDLYKEITTMEKEAR
ncbi:MAG TPA: hypothetical protein VMT62_12705 [Syntrophorhabdaceae bacterium]|nr:hypothetical protein [Syntrophorhabdaceae bacterium]